MTHTVTSDLCAGCGRPYSNWMDQGSAYRENGLKVEQAGLNDRLAEYRSWRMRWGVPYVNDVPDQIEYNRNGKPVVALELTRSGTGIPPGYLSSIWTRFTGRDVTQYRSLRLVSEALGIPAYFVVVEIGLERFHIRNINWDRWLGMNQDQYRAFITSFHQLPIKHP